MRAPDYSNIRGVRAEGPAAGGIPAQTVYPPNGGVALYSTAAYQQAHFRQSADGFYPRNGAPQASLAQIERMASNPWLGGPARPRGGAEARLGGRGAGGEECEHALLKAGGGAGAKQRHCAECGVFMSSAGSVALRAHNRKAVGGAR